MSRRAEVASVQQITRFPPESLAHAVLQQQHELDPTLDITSTLQQIRNIAESVSESLPSIAALGDVLFALNDHLFNVMHFHCSPLTRARPQHSLLHQVLAERSAEPVSLAILYISVGRWLGLPLVGCDFPDHFLVHYDDELGGVIIDPAAGGVQLQRADLAGQMHRLGVAENGVGAGAFLCDIDDQRLVLRSLSRLKLAYLREGEVLLALGVQQRIMALRPDTASGFRERGWLYEMLECPRAAAQDYSRYLRLRPYGEDAAQLFQRLTRLLRTPQVLH